ncbi:hypothetical protein [Methylorubrum extorquens]|uniref:Uncharacterized protein n=1 Tax=Methylorubrum extorquens (strain ATCC 14718 / DSM 1338 / JCM 2805 / NCIMB 9133 / AM1) TaxID=272630 RepID=C5B074_METEA|nr:hypothetical protein [Methylorubrum extorquens]ACS39424.1 Hypothetical protein MexAM1_META1p1562 [Methylorubrum extorquens AM1]MCP1542470.1 hypothetical protein [Methylorubrum extorquens]MCP1590185.1 hypothetical protein [Methylorubrum extorquens]
MARESSDNTERGGPLKDLEDAIRHAGSARAFATAKGLSHGYVSDVRAGRREPGPAVLAALGLEKRVSYVPTEGARS